MASTEAGLRRADLYRRKIDLYAVLGVEKGVTASQITKAYRALALRYHPDRNVGAGSEEAAEKFKEISTAYAILSDPNKRRQYDLAGADAHSMFESGMESVDLENLNSAMRAFGALMTRLGVPIPTQIGASTLIRAQEICKDGRIAPDSKHVDPLKLGEGISGSTNRQQGVFYKIKLTEEEAANGVILSVCSANNSRFKLVVFDSQGRVQYVQESAPTGDKKFTTATMYLVPFETITSFGQALPQFNEEPAIFNRLTTLTAESRSLGAGEHLICVYGDNWLQKTSYTLTALLADLDPQVVATVKECDEKIRQKKQELDALQEEYNQAREKFEALKAKVQEETGKTESLLLEREIAYNSFIDMSLNRHSKGGLPTIPIPTPKPTPAFVAAAAAEAEISTSVSSSPLSEHGKDSKTTPAGAGAAAAGAASGGSTRGPSSPSKRSFFSFFMPSSSSAKAK